MKMGGTVWGCYASSWSSGAVLSSGLEHAANDPGTAAIDRNIDVKMLDMAYIGNSGGWAAWGNGQTNKHPNYQVDNVDNTRFNAYLPALD
jgi:hypothetical protein